MMRTVSYNARVVGRLWMPQCLAATDRKITLGDGPWKVDIPENDMDAIESHFYGDMGDFSAVEDMEITKHVEAEDGRCVSIVTKPWADVESEYTYGDCMFPEE